MSIIANLQTYLDYVDPNIGVWRDTHIARADSLPVINGIVTLIEMPSVTQKVQVSGFIEVPMETFIKNKVINVNEFVVDYSTGIVYFSPEHEAKTFTFLYYGKGIRLISASRVYAMIKNNPNVVVTLQDYIDSLARFNESLTIKLTEINNAIAEAQQVTEQTNVAIDNSIIATQNANTAAQAALEAAASTIIIRKDSVATYEDLATVYPEPENGWQVTVDNTGDIYRYDGMVSHQWEYVGNIIGAIPRVSEDSDGILNKEDYKIFVKRPAFFSIQKILSQGVQDLAYFVMPSDGEIVSVEAYCTKVGLLYPTEIAIERISDDDYNNDGSWDNIFSQNLIFQPEGKKAIYGTVEDNQAKENDKFRVTVSQFDEAIRGISIIMTINTTYKE